MGFYQFKKELKIKASVEEVWDFISSPRNLQLITPEFLAFEITSGEPPLRMYPGMIISYTVRPILGIKTTWVTEITQVQDQSYFVDEQRVGPYAMWHHEHFIESIEGGVSMTDIVSYQPPFGFFGSIFNRWFIKRKLNQIFSFRSEAMVRKFAAYN